MQTDKKASTPSERLAPDELEAIRRHFADVDGRSDGAVGVDDVAEAFGVEPDEVRRQLDRIREERAVRPPSEPRRDQRGLLGLALVLLASAFAIHRLHPQTREEWQKEMEGRIAEMQANKKAHPKIHYPIHGQVTTGALPPPGFTLTFKGALTTTTSSSPSPSTSPPEREVAQVALTEAILNAFKVAREAEQAAPPPHEPLPKPKTIPWGRSSPGLGMLEYNVGSAGYDPEYQLSMSLTNEATLRRIVASTVASLLDEMSKSQEASLKVEPMRRDDYVMPPAGYSLTFVGFGSTSVGSARTVVLPYDAAGVARKLEWAVRRAMWKDAEPPTYSTPESRAALAKRPVPPYATVRLDGPRGKVEFRLPMTASAEYPTAADAVRAADRLLAEGVRRAASQVGPLGGTAR